MLRVALALAVVLAFVSLSPAHAAHNPPPRDCILPVDSQCVHVHGQPGSPDYAVFWCYVFVGSPWLVESTHAGDCRHIPAVA